MRSTPRFSGAAASFLLAALPSLLLAQEPGGAPASSAPAPAPAASGSVSSSSPAPSAGASGSAGGSYSSGGSSHYSGSSSSGYRGGSDYSGSRSSYGGNRFDGPRSFAPGSPGRVAESQPPARVELPGPRVGPPGMRAPVAPGNPGYSPSEPMPPRVGMPGFGRSPQFGAPGRAPLETPGRVEIPGRVGVPGVIGMPERPSQRDFAPGDDPSGVTRPGDDDTRLLPPPLEPGVGGPIVGKPAPEKPLPPSQPSYEPPQNNNLQLNNWSLYCYQYNDYRCASHYRYSRWSYWPFWGSSRHCYNMMMMQDEMDIYFSRMRGETWSGCYGYGYYDDDYGYWSYGRGFYNMGWMNLMPCAVVTAETYGGRKYSIVTMLPEFGAYGPRGLRFEIENRLHEDGEVTLQGRGSQELHLFDGFVKRVSARWCYGGEW